MEEGCEIELKHCVLPVCRGCLSTDRNLSPLGELEEIYQKLCFGDTKTGMLLCWECLAMLRKVKLFIKRVQKTQSVLSHHETDPKTSLSSLRKTKLPSIHSYDDSYQSLEGEHKNIDIFIKVEPVFNAENGGFDTNYCNQDLDVKPLIKQEAKRVKLSNKHITKRRFERQKLKYRYRTIYENFSGNAKKLVTVLDQKEVERLMNEEKNSPYFNASSLCILCLGKVDKAHIDKHMQKYHTVTPRNQYSCDICLWCTRSKSQLTKHITEHFTKRVCKFCQYECYSARHMSYHLMCHRNSVQCVLCNTNFTDVPEFYKHYNSFHVAIHTCDYCQKSYRIKANLETHILKYHLKNHYCVDCKQGYNTLKSYNSHIKRYHLRLYCVDCKRGYKTLRLYNYHMRYKHWKNRSDETFCATCNKQFDNLKQYRTHLNSTKVHKLEMGKKEVFVPCPECGKVFKCKNSMQRHFAFAHAGQAKFQCDLCSKGYTKLWALKKHRKVVHENYQQPKDKLCSICGRGFLKNRELNNHVKTHTGEKPYKCSHCDASFIQKAGLKYHYQKCHSVVVS